MADDLFTTMSGDWTPVSSNLTIGRRISSAIACGILAAIGVVLWVVLAIFAPSWVAALVGAPVVALALGLYAWVWWWAARNQKSWGYHEAEEELIVRGGIMFRRVVVVPYGRMQYVDVQAGPLASRLGYASVTLHTAASATAAEIPGVPTAEAHRLRNRLTELGESHDPGL